MPMIVEQRAICSMPLLRRRQLPHEIQSGIASYYPPPLSNGPVTAVCLTRTGPRQGKNLALPTSADDHQAHRQATPPGHCRLATSPAKTRSSSAWRIIVQAARSLLRSTHRRASPSRIVVAEDFVVDGCGGSAVRAAGVRYGPRFRTLGGPALLPHGDDVLDTSTRSPTFNSSNWAWIWLWLVVMARPRWSFWEGTSPAQLQPLCQLS